MSDKSISGGVVTFLDVLGWKGVYDRNPNAIASLTQLVEGVRLEAKKQRGRVNSDVSVKSISDTIAIFTKCTEDEITTAIEIHGKLCQWIIPRSIDFEIPVRGAIAYGEFEMKENIFIGKAVDEAASWHEHADWIGVHLTPSAEFAFTPQMNASLWKKYKTPNKSRLDWETHCVDWTIGWKDRELELKRMKDKFRRLGPIVPEIAGKFTNTLKYISECSAGR